MARFVEAAAYYELSLAELAKAKLQSEEIFCFLHTKHHTSMKWYLSLALGGVRVFVKSEDKDRARTILNADESALLSEIDFPAPGVEDLCASCHSENLKKVDLKHISCFLIVATGLPLFFWGSYYKCRDCGHKN